MLKNPEYTQSFDGYENDQVETHVEPVAEELAHEEIEEVEELYEEENLENRGSTKSNCKN